MPDRYALAAAFLTFQASNFRNRRADRFALARSSGLTRGSFVARSRLANSFPWSGRLEWDIGVGFILGFSATRRSGLVPSDSSNTAMVSFGT